MGRETERFIFEVGEGLIDDHQSAALSCAQQSEQICGVEASPVRIVGVTDDDCGRVVQFPEIIHLFDLASRSGKGACIFAVSGAKDRDRLLLKQRGRREIKICVPCAAATMDASETP